MIELLGDFETASACDLRKCGAWRYSEDVTTEVLCFHYTVAGGHVRRWHPGADKTVLMEYATDYAVVFVAHNAGFEKAIWRSIMVPDFGFPDIPDDRWHDTMAICAMKVLPQDLDRAAHALRLPVTKDRVGSAFTKKMSKFNKQGMLDRTPESLEKVYAYCDQDIKAEWLLHKRVGGFQPGERDVWLLDQRINQRGIHLDLEYISASRSIVDQASVPLAAEFQEITGGLAFTQRDKVINWVRGQGVEIPDMTKETLAGMLGEVEEEEDIGLPLAVPLPPDVHRALHIRQLIGSASIKKLARMEGCICADGRARGLLQYHGAGPGRWAGRLLQPHNFPRGTVKLDGEAPPPETVVAAILTRDPAWVELMLGPPVETVVSGLRHALIPASGHTFVAGDFAQIEARVVLSLAGQHDKTTLMAAGQDIYNDMASSIYGRPIDRKHGDAEEGQTGKNSVLGLGFQMGWKKFKSRYGNGQEDEFFKHVVQTYREEWAPEVPKLWAGIEHAALRTVWDGTPHEAYGVRYELDDGWMTARLPSGRKLYYWNPQKCRKAMPWDDTDVRPAWTYQAMKMGQWRTIDAFGGLLTENVVQALARDIMVSAMFRCEKENFPIVLTVHDEIITEPEIAHADPEALEQIMGDSPDWVWDLQVPVKAEVWNGERYRK